MLYFGIALLAILGVIIIFFCSIELQRQLVKEKRKKKSSRETNDKDEFNDKYKVSVNSFEKQVPNSINNNTRDIKEVSVSPNDKSVIKGKEGEQLIFQELKKFRQEAKVLKNIYIPTEDDSITEVDLVMIDQTGFYVIESKNYSGWIFGNEKDKNWTQTFPNKSKFKFNNPIRQNYGHIETLKYITQIFNDECFYSCIVFSERCKLKSISVDFPNVFVVKRNDLKKALSLNMKKSEEVFSKKEVEELYYVLLNYTKEDEYIKKLHVKNIINKHRR